MGIGILSLKSYLMKQIYIFINRLVTFANVAIAHRSITPGTKTNELVLVPIRAK